MNVAFIEQHQIIERYLTGKLPLKGVQDFERWCRENPDTVAQLGLSDRINSALRLLDVAGEPLPWDERPRAAWQSLRVFASMTAVAVIAVVASMALFASGRNKSATIANLQQTVTEQPLLPLQATRSVTMELSRNGLPSRSQVAVGAGRTELADFKFDLTWSGYNNFVVTIDRIDQGRVAVLTNLVRDSNGHVRVALNSSALGPGDYAVQVDGLDLRRGTLAQGWARFTVTR
ncbi:MAG TPA: hypothetical protein VMK82_01405 [Steroidobacteraceae bacterium]|nr:hypothetical protein [Steroidobacteraceae bacterium]